MNIFNLLKQRSTANDDYNLKTVSDKELDDFIQGIPTDQVFELRVFKQVAFNDLLARGLRAARKGAKGDKTLTHTVTAVAFAAIDVAKYMLDTMAKYNPAATELVRRRLKEKVAKW